METEIINYAQVATKAIVIIAIGASLAALWHLFVFILRRRKGDSDEQGLAMACVNSLYLPVLIYILGVSILYAGNSVNEVLTVGLEVVLAPSGYLLKLGCIVFAMILLVDRISMYAVSMVRRRMQRLEQDRVRKVASVAAKGMQFLILVMAVLMAMDYLGFNITSIVALGSVGGLVLGLASQDILSNLLGRITLYMEKPFSPGDHIICGGVEGIATKMKWRITEIRTFDRHMLYVPNNLLINNPIHNHSRRSNRRISQTIGIRYDDAGSLPKIIEDVEQMLVAHPGVDEKDTLVVKFTNFGASSLDFMVYAMMHETDWARAKAVRHDVLLKIIDIVLDNGAEFAFPTRTLHMINEQPEAAEPAR